MPAFAGGKTRRWTCCAGALGLMRRRQPAPARNAPLSASGSPGARRGPPATWARPGHTSPSAPPTRPLACAACRAACVGWRASARRKRATSRAPRLATRAAHVLRRTGVVLLRDSLVERRGHPVGIFQVRFRAARRRNAAVVAAGRRCQSTNARRAPRGAQQRATRWHAPWSAPLGCAMAHPPARWRRGNPWRHAEHDHGGRRRYECHVSDCAVGVWESRAPDGRGRCSIAKTLLAPGAVTAMVSAGVAAPQVRLSCRRALRGAEATTSAGTLLQQRRAVSTRRAPVRQAPSALLKVREDLRAAGAITWSQVRRLRRCATFRRRLPQPPPAAHTPARL